MKSNGFTVFTNEELSDMKHDWERTGHNLQQVAELHGCSKAEAAAALNLTEAEFKAATKKKLPKRPNWEERNLDKAAYFIKLLENGEKMADACAAVGIGKVDTGYKIYKRIKERSIDMTNQEIIAAAQAAEPVQPEDFTPDTPETAAGQSLPEKLLADLEAMSRLVELLNQEKLVSDAELDVCDRLLAMVDAFRAGAKYAEAHHD